MKSKFISALSISLALCLLCGSTALAADETATQTTITYTKTASDTQQAATQEPAENSGPSLPVYEIVIPSELSLNSVNVMPIYLKENNLSEGQTLNIYLDGASTFDDDWFLHLYGTQGQTSAKVSVGYYDNDGYKNHMGDKGNYRIAAFESGNVHPVVNGTLYFEVTNESELLPDTYTGTLFFTMSVTSE